MIRRLPLLPCIALLATLCACSGDDAFVPVVGGTLNIETAPYGIAAEWNVSGPEGFARRGQGNTSLRGLVPGGYTVVWSDVPGWDTPAPTSAQVTAGGHAACRGAYVSRHWIPRDTGVEVDLMDVAFVDRRRGWAVGGEGTILHTADGGATWQRQESGRTETLRAVAFCDSVNGIAVGDEAVILRTWNGGRRWFRQEIEIAVDWWGNPMEPLPGDFMDAHMRSPLWATVVGYGGGIYATLDGGAQWARQYSQTRAAVHGLAFHGERDAIAVGEAGAILWTFNAGAAWLHRDSGTDEMLVAVSFGDADHGTAVGSHGTILRTEDGGATWTPQDSGTTALLYDVCFVDASVGTIVGQGGTVLRTEDGGSTWTPQAGGTFRFLLAVDLVDVDFGATVGLEGAAFVAADGGGP